MHSQPNPERVFCSAALRDALAGALALLPALGVGPTTTCGRRRAIIPGKRVALARRSADLR